MSQLNLIPAGIRADMRTNSGSTYGYWDLHSSEGTKLATVRLTTMGRAKALAQLFAAAPDLLEALKNCLETDAGSLDPSAVHKAYEAIQKAEGK